MIYLDNAATSYPKPACVGRELTRSLRVYPGNPGRSGHKLSLAAAECVYRTRCVVRDLLHAETEEQIVFSQNATFAINTILRARLVPGMHVLISDVEHNAVFRPLHRLKEDGLITYSIFPHEDLTEETLSNMVTPATKMLLCTHISNVTGVVLPVEMIARFCRKNGIYCILDASQSIGHREVDVRRIPCDALCAPGHKGLLGIQGSGILYLRNGDGIRDVFQGGSGADSLSPYMPAYLPDRLEPGTLSTPAIGALGASVSWLLKHGIASIETKERDFTTHMHQLLRSIPEIELYSEATSGITAFRLTGESSDETAAALDAAGICVRGGLQCAPLAHRTLGTLDTGLVRLSCGPFSTRAQANAVARKLRDYLKTRENRKTGG